MKISLTIGTRNPVNFGIKRAFGALLATLMVSCNGSYEVNFRSGDNPAIANAPSADGDGSIAALETVSQQSAVLFEYNGALPGSMTFDKSAIFWNPTDIGSPGFHLAFYGSPDPNSGCAITSNGPTVLWQFADSLNDTGIADGTDKWAPICNEWQGTSYARVNQNNGTTSQRGIGLFTNAGPKPFTWDQSGSFFTPYPATGDQNGANAFIEGLFAVFRFEPVDSPTSVKPWNTAAVDYDQRIFAIDTNQQLTKLSVGSVNSQAQQKTGVTILNPSCLTSNPNSPAYCQFQLLFYNALVESNKPYSDYATVYADPSQGGLPVIYGPIREGGVSTSMACPSYGCGNDVWTSWGSPVQRASYVGSKYFNVQISFNQLLRILNVTTAAKLQKSIPTASDVMSLYGARYSDPSAWIVLDLSFSQEVYNPDLSHSVLVGGSLSSARLISLGSVAAPRSNSDSNTEVAQGGSSEVSAAEASPAVPNLPSTPSPTAEAVPVTSVLPTPSPSPTPVASITATPTPVATPAVPTPVVSSTPVATVTPAALPALTTIYRSYNPANIDHLYSTIENEGAPTWIPTGPQFKLYASPTTDCSIALYRFLLSNGTHFVTTSAVAEGSAGAILEGTYGFACNPNTAGTVPLARLYAPSYGVHYYTTNPLETSYLILSSVWIFESTTGWVFP